MPVEVKMPKLGLTMEEGKIVQWLKKPGDPVEKDETIAVIETEKLTGEVKSPEKGFLAKILAKEGETVPVGQVIALLATTREELEQLLGGKPVEAPEKPTPTPPAPPTPGEKKEERITETPPPVSLPGAAEEKPVGRIRATPAARRLAKEKGIPLEMVRGTGPGGIITYRDVERALEEARAPPAAAPPREEMILPLVRPQPSLLPRVAEEKPLTPMRARIAENLSRSAREMVLTTITMEVNVDEVLRIRSMLPKEKKPSITAFITKALALALREHPLFNATLKEDRIVVYRDINIGVAVALPDGLVTPVVRNADEKTVLRLHEEIKSLAEKARTGKLTVDDLRGATITFSNLGMYGVDVFTPIIYPGHIAVLGAGRVYEKPVIENGELKAKHYLILSLTFDHRAVDGAQAAEFLATVKRYLENPYLALIE